MTPRFWQKVSKTAVLAAVLLMVALFSLLRPAPVSAGPLACAGSPYTVLTQTELFDAIGCINGAGAGSYEIMLQADITLTASTPAINNAAATSIVIDGNGLYALDGGGSYRPVEISYGTVTIQNITIRNGRAIFGGGIYNLSGALTVRNSTLSGNSATGSSGGGIYNQLGTLTVTNGTISGNSAISYGGGIYNTGTVTLTNSTISGNSATNGGGISSSGVIGGTVTLTNSTISGNSASSAGGGIRADGTVTLTNSIIAKSTSGGDCASVSGTVNASHSLIEDGLGCVNGTNTANLTGDPALGPLQDNGGPTWTHALLAGSPAIDTGSNALAVDAGSSLLTTDQRGTGFPRIVGTAVDMGAFEVQCAAFPRSVANEAELNDAIACYNALAAAGTYQITLTADIDLTASTTAIDNDKAGVELLLEGRGYTVDGQDISGVRPFRIGPYATVTMLDLTVTRGETPFSGGGILNYGTLALHRSRLTDNNSGYAGGGIFNSGSLALFDSTVAQNNALTSGGGIYNEGTLTITSSTIENNTTPGYGGGVLSDGTLEIVNSTLSDNYADVGGGGIRQAGGSSLLVNSTLSGNGVTYTSSGGIEIAQGTAELNNSIIANSINGDCQLVGGTINARNSLIEDNLTCVNGTNTNNLTGDPNLGPLQNNGGTTETHALLNGSPAIGAGLNSLALDASSSPLAFDQRGAGFPRILGTAVDMGAFEALLCPGFPMNVGTAGELDQAIACYNALGSGEVRIDLTADIDLTASTLAIEPDSVSLTIEGNGYTVDGQDIEGVRPFSIIAVTFDPVTMQNLTITGGIIGDPDSDIFDGLGGGILNIGGLLFLSNTTVDGNSALLGGGIASFYGLTVVQDSTISNNTALAGGGGIVNLAGGTGILNSTVSGNAAEGENIEPLSLTDLSGLMASGTGRGFANGDLAAAVGILNSTAAGKFMTDSLALNLLELSGAADRSSGSALESLQALASPQDAVAIGGGIANAGQMVLINSTISDNSAGAANYGGGILNIDGPLELANTIVANSSGLTNEDCVNEDSSTPVIASHSLFETAAGDGTCGVVGGVDGNITGVDPLLGPLQNNGGPTETHALLSGSPAIDTGLDSLALDVDGSTPLTTDQRGTGFPRFVGTVDMGAFEAESSAPPTACPEVAGNIITNPCFEDGPSPWTFWTDGAGTYLTSSADPYQGQFAADVAVQTAGGNVQLYQKNLPLKPNTEYQLSFAARSSNGRDLRAVVHQHDAPFTNYGLNWNVDVGTGWTVYETKFTTKGFNAPVNDARLRFYFGPFDTDNMSYHIDWVVLREYDSGNPPPPIPTDPPVIVPPPGQCNPPVAGNLIGNPGFESGTSDWTFFTDGKGVFDTATVDPYECDNNAKVSIQKQGSNVQLYQKDISLQGGETYVLRLAARSSGGQDVKLFMHKHTANYDNYGLNGIQLDLTPAWQVFVVEFTAKGNVPLTDARLRLWLAPFDQNGASFEFDDLLLLPKSDFLALTTAAAADSQQPAPTEFADKKKPPKNQGQGQPANSVLVQGYFLDGDESGRLSGGYVPENGAVWCYAARPSLATLFPANGKMARVRITGVGAAQRVVITSIFQNEQVGPQPDASGVGTSFAQLRRERDDSGTGRVYSIAFTAVYKGKTCNGSVVVGVPIDRATPASAGSFDYDSTQ